jgi:hypothetical protein
MEKFQATQATFGRSYNPYGLNKPRSQQGRIRIALIGALLLGGLHALVMQPYAVTYHGDCLYEIRPTGWNGEEVVPCGTLLTRFSIKEEIYLADR